MKDFNKNTFPQLAFSLIFSSITIQQKDKLIFNSPILKCIKNYQDVFQKDSNLNIDISYWNIKQLHISL